MSSWRTKMDGSVEVEKMATSLYRAVGYYRVHPGSPHRALFMSATGRAAAWGFSLEQAGRRCEARIKARVEHDEEVYRDRQARRVTYRGES